MCEPPAFHFFYPITADSRAQEINPAFCFYAAGSEFVFARSRASIRSEAENCHRRNSLPPLNDEMVRGLLRQAEAQIKRQLSFESCLFIWSGRRDSNSLNHPTKGKPFAGAPYLHGLKVPSAQVEAASSFSRGVARQFEAKLRIVIGGIHFRR